jgi:lysozyme
VLITIGGIFYFNFFDSNTPSVSKYPVRGIDISKYQKNIDWNKLKKENIQFVYIKATEGSYTADPKFKENWINAVKNGYKVGAYLFYVPNRDGKDQANMFIETVPNLRKNLPPVVDLEFSKNNRSGKSKEQILREIHECLIEIENHYNRKPLLYTNISFYNYYIKGNLDNYKLWIRDDKDTPRIDASQWVIWQYTEHGRLDGIEGYVDMNVIKGSWSDLD